MSERNKLVDDGRVEIEAPLDGGLVGVNGDLDVLTVGTLSGTANGAMEVVNDTSTGDRSAQIQNNFQELFEKVNHLLKGRNPVWELYGTNAASGVAGIYHLNGGLKLLTAGANNDQAGIQAQANAGQSLFGTAGFLGSEDSPRFEAVIKTGSAITAQKIFFGLSLTSTMDASTDDDGIKIVYTTASTHGKFEVWSSRATADSVFTTDVTVAVDSIYRLKLEVYPDLTFMAFINDKPVYHSPFPAIVTAKDLVPFIGIQALTGAAKHMYVLGRPRVSRLAS